MSPAVAVALLLFVVLLPVTSWWYAALFGAAGLVCLVAVRGVVDDFGG